jgi:hypothetical protein
MAKTEVRVLEWTREADREFLLLITGKMSQEKKTVWQKAIQRDEGSC